MEKTAPPSVLEGIDRCLKGLIQTASRDADVKRLTGRLKKHRHHLFTFFSSKPIATLVEADADLDHYARHHLNSLQVGKGLPRNKACHSARSEAESQNPARGLMRDSGPCDYAQGDGCDYAQGDGCDKVSPSNRPQVHGQAKLPVTPA